MEEKVLEYLTNKPLKLCVISTVTSDQKPESALVGYAVLPDLSILINTNHKTRKWANIQTNTHVAIVFGFGFAELNVQYEGTGELLEDGDSLKKYDDLFFSQNEDARKFKTPDTRIIKITPTWIRSMDTSVMPPVQEEKLF